MANSFLQQSRAGKGSTLANYFSVLIKQIVDTCDI